MILLSAFGSKHSPPDGASGGGSLDSQTGTPTDFDLTPVGGSASHYSPHDHLKDSGMKAASPGQYWQGLLVDPVIRLKLEKLEMVRAKVLKLYQ